MIKPLPAKALHQLDIEHPRYQEVDRQLFTQLAMGAPGSVVLLVGPTRVGKSRLVQSVARRLVQSPISDDELPVILVEAATTHGGRFSMKHFTMRALQALRHPMYGELGGIIRQRESETELRIKLEQSIIYRKTRYLFIDEAHHLLRTNRGAQASDILDSLKCLANTTDIILVLAGGYELFAAGPSSAHLNGRMRVIEFGRYRPSGQDELNFLGILKGLDPHLPWKTGSSLIVHSSYISAGTLGCLGLLLGWVNAAMCEMHSRGERALRVEHFMETRYEEQIALIAREIAEGESAMRKLPTPSSETKKGADTKCRAKEQRRPFQRKPKRDPVAPPTR
ncbi:AAA family ATPase [Stenotrophomonas maltophilia]|uniref:AAA family ATPase n=1 Tax=Stenotrophomonas maltophilia TaxID=40324 RepID=UPI0034D61D27